MITGIKEVREALRALPKAVNNDKVWSDINYDRSKIIVNRAKLNAPEGPRGDLVDSIGSVRMKRQGLGTVWTGARRRGGKKGFHAHLVEDGTKQRKTKKGANRGIMPKNPFMEKTFIQTAPEVEKALGTSATRVITRTAKRYLK